MATRFEMLSGVFRSWVTRIWVLGGAAAAIYQFGCDQFDWPKLPVLWGMTGVFVPWWAWLIVAQFGFTYGLFELVRRQSPVPAAAPIGMRESLGAGESSGPKLTRSEKEKVSSALIAVADYLKGDFAKLIQPLRDITVWQSILEAEGADALRDATEQGRIISRELPAKMKSAIKGYEFELGLVGVDPMKVTARSLQLDDILHGLGSVAFNMKEPNIASARIAGEAYVREFQALTDELERVKGQIADARRKLANGELG